MRYSALMHSLANHSVVSDPGGSRGNMKQPVHEADLIGNARLAGEAVSASDHAHDLEALIVAVAVFKVWKPRVGRILLSAR